MAVVLLVDDDPEDIGNYRDKLVEAGHRVFTTEDVKEAKECLHRHEIDYIVLDMGIPPDPEEVLERLEKGESPTEIAEKAILSGVDVYRYIQEKFPQLEEKVLILSVLTSGHIQGQARNVKFRCQFMLKDADPIEIFRAILKGLS